MEITTIKYNKEMGWHAEALIILNCETKEEAEEIAKRINAGNKPKGKEE